MPLSAELNFALTAIGRAWDALNAKERARIGPQLAKLIGKMVLVCPQEAEPQVIAPNEEISPVTPNDVSAAAGQRDGVYVIDGSGPNYPIFNVYTRSQDGIEFIGSYANEADARFEWAKSARILGRADAHPSHAKVYIFKDGRWNKVS